MLQFSEGLSLTKTPSGKRWRTIRKKCGGMEESLVSQEDLKSLEAAEAGRAEVSKIQSL